MGSHPEWGTRLYNFNLEETNSFLHSNAIFWLDEYGIDGYRYDGIASMLYLDYGREGNFWERAHDGSNINYPAINFIKKFNMIVHRFNSRSPYNEYRN